MADEKIEIEIVLDDGSIKKGFTTIEKQSKKTGDKIEKEFKSSFGGLTTTILGIGATLATVFGGRRILAAAAAQEDAVNALNQSLKSAGTFSQEASESFQNLARSLQETTVFGDETILQFGALARNFTQTNEEAEKLTKAAIELSAATGLSLESSVKNLGKTFAGLTGELGESVPALRNLTAEQLKAGAGIDLILERFSGSASAQIQTFSGRIEQLSNIFGDLLEQVGFIVTKSPVLVKVFGVIGDKFQAFVKSVGDFRQSGDVFGDLLKSMISFADGIVTFVIAPIELVFNGVLLAVSTLQAAIQGVIFGIVSSASKLVNFFAPDGELAQNLNAFTEASAVTLDEFTLKAEESFNKIGNFKFTAGADSLIEELKAAADAAEEPLNKLADKFVETKVKVSAQMLEMTATVNKLVGTALGSIVKKGVASIGASLVNGGDAFKDFGKFVLNILGDLAINVGFILSGMGKALAAIAAALTNPYLAGAGIAAGLALIVLGGALKALAGGSSGGDSVSGSPASGATESFGGESSEEDFEEADLEEQGSAVVINVEGTVLDPAGVGEQIVEVLNEAGFTNGARTIA